jgi:hypothetical protein
MPAEGDTSVADLTNALSVHGMSLWCQSAANTSRRAAEITVLKVGIERAFPVVSRMDGERRLWTNDMVGHKLIVDKCTLEETPSPSRGTSSW